MSGAPTEAEVQTQWQNAVDLLETIRNVLDGSLFGSGNKVDTLLQSLEGEYTPSGIASAVTAFRARGSSMIDPGAVREFLTPLLYEYGFVMSRDASAGYGAGFSSIDELFSALYDWFIDNSLTVQSREITYDTPSADGGNTGNGSLSRLTVDENDYDLEYCHIEKKMFRCIADQNTGVDETRETFEVIGEQASQDALLLTTFGSGEGGRALLRSHHAGSGAGGSLLKNSSFSTYDSSATPRFSGWTKTGAATLTQDTDNYYRTHPGAQTDASLKADDSFKIVQSLSDMRVRNLDPNTPYFLRVMLNADTHSASGGSVTIRMGSTTATVTIASLSGSAWTELTLTADKDCWFKQFNEDPFDIEIEWASASSGALLVDDVLFAPWNYIDGTYFFLRGGATPWLVDDEFVLTDTGGAPATAKIQWWLFVAGLGYLPHAATPTFSDP